MYASGTSAQYSPSATGTATGLTPGQTYQMVVELLRNDLGSASERATAIRVGEQGGALTDIGGCNPDGGDCASETTPNPRSRAHAPSSSMSP